MRRVGQLLMLLGLAVGGSVGIAMLLHLPFSGVPWLIGVGLAKLGLVTSGGLMAVGAFLQRGANRRDDRTRLPRVEL